MTAKSTGLADRRVNPRIASFAEFPNKTTGITMLVFNIAVYANEYYSLFSLNDDHSAIHEQIGLLNRATNAVDKYIHKYGIPSQYLDKNNLGAIINYVFQGQNSTGDKMITKIGNAILKYIGRYDKKSNKYKPLIQE